jgi:hypothetical protein
MAYFELMEKSEIRKCTTHELGANKQKQEWPLAWFVLVKIFVQSALP